eukprot:scaffold35557_cov18-Tisochrysis_lutea.AAC.1
MSVAGAQCSLFPQCSPLLLKQHLLSMPAVYDWQAFLLGLVLHRGQAGKSRLYYYIRLQGQPSGVTEDCDSTWPKNAQLNKLLLNKKNHVYCNLVSIEEHEVDYHNPPMMLKGSKLLDQTIAQNIW